jgi:hypothetical protein
MAIRIRRPRSKLICRSWVLYGLSDKDILTAQKEVDRIFTDYSFYPEVEWDDYRVFPPEGYQVMGAWRQTESKVFAFLIDNPNMSKGKTGTQLLVYVIGETSEFSILESQLMVLKGLFAFEEDSVKSGNYLGQRLDRIERSKSLSFLTRILGVYTAVINAFALYLRQLTPPTSWNSTLVGVLNVFTILVHFAALLLLVVFIFFVGAFLVKYGTILLKRM